MNTSHFKKQWRLAWIATTAGLTMMMPAFLAGGIRELRLRSIAPESWSAVLMCAEFILLVATPFWALSMARGFLASPLAKHYRDELRADGERVLRERGVPVDDNAA